MRHTDGMDADRPVSIFKTDDPAVLPLATMALESEGIQHFVKSEGKADSLNWQMSQTPTNRPMVMEILVASDDADRARDLLKDLEHPTPPAPAPEESPSVILEDVATGRELGSITESQLQELTSGFDEDGPQQYRVTAALVDELQRADVEPGLIALLRDALAGSGLVIRWVVR